MKAKKLIDALGGPQQVADLLNKADNALMWGKPSRSITRQRVWNWCKSDKIPDWAQLTYPRVWAKAARLSEK